jgi:triosephosphate isomerase (TIM)
MSAYKMKYIIANWKMNMDLRAITLWYEEFEKNFPVKNPDCKIIIAPSFVHVPLLKEFPDNSLEIATQDVSQNEKGAHTGDVGVFQIKEFCRYSLVGHSERKEPMDTVIKKRDLCLKENIIPIVCFKDLKDVVKVWIKGTLLAWEDPQNISVNGVYKDKDPKDIEKGVAQIRKLIPAEAALIYGGSVNEKNIQNLVKIDGLDGVLVGNASLDPKHFTEIIKAFFPD